MGKIEEAEKDEKQAKELKEPFVTFLQQFRENLRKTQQRMQETYELLKQQQLNPPKEGKGNKQTRNTSDKHKHKQTKIQ